MNQHDQVLSPQHAIFVAGHRGMVGSAILRRLEAEGFRRLVTRSHAELDLTDQAAVRGFFRSQRVDHVVLAAARVGGIQANSTYPADFIYDNLMIQANVIHEAFRAGVRRLLVLGSSCIYPRAAPQPMGEQDLLTGPLEATNEPYAIAKIAGIKLCESYNRQHGTGYRAVMPTNLYGPNDNYDLEISHVLPAMIRKYHLAKLAAAGDLAGIAADEAAHGPIPEAVRAALGLGTRPPGVPRVILWGTGDPYREFLHVDDMAAACRLVMGLEDAAYARETRPMRFHLNVGAGADITIRHLAALVAAVVGFEGQTVWDTTRPDGTPRKLLDVARLRRLGWSPAIRLEDGIRSTYAAYCQNIGLRTA
jgi:GDP-L-fucose synthase